MHTHWPSLSLWTCAWNIRLRSHRLCQAFPPKHHSAPGPFLWPLMFPVTSAATYALLGYSLPENVLRNTMAGGIDDKDFKFKTREKLPLHKRWVKSFNDAKSWSRRLCELHICVSILGNARKYTKSVCHLTETQENMLVCAFLPWMNGDL